MKASSMISPDLIIPMVMFFEFLLLFFFFFSTLFSLFPRTTTNFHFVRFLSVVL